MNPNPPLIQKNASIGEVARKVCKKSHVWVVEKKGSKEIIGIITEKDFLEVVSPLPSKSYTIGVITPKSLQHTEFKKAEDIMTKPVAKCRPKTTMEEALQLMAKHRVRRLAVAENDEIMGELSLSIVINTYFCVQNGL